MTVLYPDWFGKSLSLTHCNMVSGLLLLYKTGCLSISATVGERSRNTGIGNIFSGKLCKSCGFGEISSSSKMLHFRMATGFQL